MTLVRLFDLCHARAGDKGNDALLVLTPYSLEDLPALLRLVTPAALARHFVASSVDDVSVIPAHNLSSLVIVVRGRLQGGVTRSLTIDPHGKTLSSHLLDMRVEWPAGSGSDALGSKRLGNGSESG